MSLTERSRAALYQGLITVIDDEQAVEEMMSYFPARDVEEPVTKEFLRAEMADLRAELRAEMASQLSGLRGEMAALGSDLRGEIAAGDAGLRDEISTLGRDLRADIHRMAAINVASLAAFAGVVIAAVRL